MLKQIVFCRVILLAASLATNGCVSKSTSYEPEADREGIRAVVQQHMKELRQCYYATLDTNPAAEGKLVLAWDLNSQGHAVNSKVESVTGKRGIENVGPCLLERLNSWQFPHPAENEPTSVSYPLYFSENGKTSF